jgi:hypothetical protein
MSLRQADHPSREILLIEGCHFKRFTNFKTEATTARAGLFRQRRVATGDKEEKEEEEENSEKFKSK